jgi:hypothetical protein
MPSTTCSWCGCSGFAIFNPCGACKHNLTGVSAIIGDMFWGACAGRPKKYKWERDNFLIKKPGRFQRKGPGNFTNLICLYV